MDEQRYAELLALHRPVIIESPEEHDRMLTLAETLMEQGDELPLEEQKLLAMVVLLIEAFEVSILQDEESEEDDGPAEPPAPHATLQRLVDARGLELQDIAHVFGNTLAAREVLDGKRPISRGQAKELGKFFGMPAKLFHG